MWIDPMAEEIDTEKPPPLDGWRVLLGVIEDRRPAWHADAACRYADGVTFSFLKLDERRPAGVVQPDMQ